MSQTPTHSTTEKNKPIVQKLFATSHASFSSAKAARYAAIAATMAANK